MTTNANPANHPKSFLSRFSYSTSALMIWALVLGGLVGIFFGEMVAWMSVIGKGFILLMQMTVYPYIVVSLVGGIGRLSMTDARLLFTKAGGDIVAWET